MQVVELRMDQPASALDVETLMSKCSVWMGDIGGHGSMDSSLGIVDAHTRKIIEGIIGISTIGNIELFNNQQGSKKIYIYI